MTAKHGLWKFYQGHRHLVDFTPLNARLDAAYARCLANGGHRPSGESVLRDFGNHQRNLPICRKCHVPFGGPRLTSAQHRWNGVSE